VPGSVPHVHVHGFAVSGAYLLPTARALASRATTLVPDLPPRSRISSERRTGESSRKVRVRPQGVSRRDVIRCHAGARVTGQEDSDGV